FPSRVIATRTASSLSAACMAIGFLVLTKSTLWPLVNIGVITIKMISSTNITSTIGVTLMSDTGGGICFFSMEFLLSRRQTARLSALLGYRPVTLLEEVID